MAFAQLAAAPDPPLDELCLAIVAEFRPVDAPAALARLDALGDEVGEAGGDLVEVLATRHAFTGDRAQYDAPENSMLDRVLERRRGLPILLSVLYAEVGRRAGLPFVGVGLPGHFVVGSFAGPEPVLLDPFHGGVPVRFDGPPELVRPWTAHETGLRVLNNLAPALERRGDIGAAMRAADMRLLLPGGDAFAHDALALRARLN